MGLGARLGSCAVDGDLEPLSSFVGELDVQEKDVFDPQVEVCDFVEIQMSVVGIIGNFECWEESWYKVSTKFVVRDVVV